MMQKTVSRALQRIIAVSNSAKKDIRKDFRIPEQRFRIVPNGINTEQFHPIPGIEREKNRLITTNSSDTPLKGLYYLLLALSRIPADPPVHLVVVGVPSKNGDVLKLIKTLGIGNRVEFTGRIDHDAFVRQYARASIAVVPSIYEGFGLPAGEAMACAVPVISTTGGALPEVVGDAGMLVPPADPDALASAISALLGNPDRAKNLGHAGYMRVQSHFTWRRAAERTVDVYREAIGDHRRF
jgi:glycosyltransferase involved in cell wall biosynthesis